MILKNVKFHLKQTNTYSNIIVPIPLNSRHAFNNLSFSLKIKVARKPF